MIRSNPRPSSNVEDGDYDEDFEDASVRHAFIRRVYLILTVQLLISLGIICIFVYIEDLQDYVTENSYLVLVAAGITLATMIALACCPDVRRRTPGNYICLGIFTVADSFLLGTIASAYEPMTVLLAVGITAAICFVLTIFAMQTKIDFTLMGGFLLVVLIVFLVFGIIMIFFRNQMMRMIYCGIGVIIFSLYLLYDTQLMLGGKHQYSLSPDEHVFAALNLFIDIVQIFLFILRLLGGHG